MKRSAINSYIYEALNLFASHGLHLPPFARWTPEEWQDKGQEVREIVDTMLGWDVTDFGLGSFLETGLLLFTMRNGSQTQRDRYPKEYAEKVMIVREGQRTPCHHHWQKREDIINRGGGNLVLRLYRADRDNRPTRQPFSVVTDGVTRELQAGDTLVLTPGESISLVPHLFHTFWGEPGSGPVIVGEVSAVNDDLHDNCFLEKVGRFPIIEEDVPPAFLLCHEYPRPESKK